MHNKMFCTEVYVTVNDKTNKKQEIKLNKNHKFIRELKNHMWIVQYNDTNEA